MDKGKQGFQPVSKEELSRLREEGKEDLASYYEGIQDNRRNVIKTPGGGHRVEWANDEEFRVEQKYGLPGNNPDFTDELNELNRLKRIGKGPKPFPGRPNQITNEQRDAYESYLVHTHPGASDREIKAIIAVTVDGDATPKQVQMAVEAAQKYPRNR